MSLSNESNKQSYSPAGGTTSFEFGVSYFDDTDIVVTIEDVAGEISELINETGFTVTATNGDPENGATVVLDSATTAGDTVVISRQVPYTQEYDLQDGSSIDPTALNRGLDRTVAQSQQLLDDGERHLTHPITDPSGLTYDAPSVALRASKAAGWDALGNVTALALGGSSGINAADTSKGLDLTGDGGTIFAKVDDTTIEFNSGDIALKDGGVTSDKIDNSVILAVIDATYPVGSIYTNASVATNPATLLGVGTWTAFGAGQVPVGLNGADTDFDVAGFGTNTNGTTGAKTHTLLEAEMPAHTHSVDVSSEEDVQGGGSTAVASNTSSVTGSTGGDGAHNNLQPYIVVYMWKRTA